MSPTEHYVIDMIRGVRSVGGVYYVDFLVCCLFNGNEPVLFGIS